MSKPEILRLLWDIVVFRLVPYLVEYDLFKPTNFFIQLHIYEFSYKFDTVLYQFLETGTSDSCLICIVQRLRFSGFILYPLSFFFYSPCNEVHKIKTREATRSQGRTIKFDPYSFYLFHSGETFVSVKISVFHLKIEQILMKEKRQRIKLTEFNVLLRCIRMHRKM